MPHTSLVVQKQNSDVTHQYEQRFDTYNSYLFQNKGAVDKTRQHLSNEKKTSVVNRKVGLQKHIVQHGSGQDRGRAFHHQLVRETQRKIENRMYLTVPQLMGLLNQPSRIWAESTMVNGSTLNAVSSLGGVTPPLYGGMGVTHSQQSHSGNGSKVQPDPPSGRPLHKIDARLDDHVDLNQVPPLLLSSMPMSAMNHILIRTFQQGAKRQTLNRCGDENGVRNLLDHRGTQRTTNSNLFIKISQYVDHSVQSALDKVSEKQIKLYQPLEKSIGEMHRKLSPENIVNDEAMRIIIKRLRAHYYEERSRMGMIR
ncbi:MAG: hypothetical protein CSB13_09200 [Chloroflexi bacterium]|nr:MAG: hypothetical protein CSB13_09200 [Chloroflexota bacterium]